MPQPASHDADAFPESRGGSLKLTSATVRLSLLGGFRLTVDGLTVPLLLSAQRLASFLALQPRPLPRLYVAGVLWPDVPECRASGSLRTALWRLRVPGTPIVHTRNDHLQLSPRVLVDVREAEAWARSVCDPRFQCPDPVAAELPYRHELLPGWYDDWILIERERQRQLSLHTLETLTDRLAAQGRYGAAVLAGLAAVSAEPLRESAHRALIRAHLAEGNPSEAVRQYRSYAELLKRELDLTPSGAMRKLLDGVEIIDAGVTVASPY